MLRTLISLSFAATILAPVASALDDARAYGQPEPPPGCIVGRQWEDGSRLAYCASGDVWAYDPDGNVATGKLPGWYPATWF